MILLISILSILFLRSTAKSQNSASETELKVPQFNQRKKFLIKPPLVPVFPLKPISWPSVLCRPMQNKSPRFRKKSYSVFKHFFQSTDSHLGTGEFSLPPDSQVSVRSRRCYDSDMNTYTGHQFKYYIANGPRRLVQEKNTMDLFSDKFSRKRVSSKSFKNSRTKMSKRKSAFSAV